MLRTVALLAVVGTATACADRVDPSAWSDSQAWAAMYPSALDVVKAVDPRTEPEEFADGHDACHPSDFIGDSLDEREVIRAASITLSLPPLDRRSPTQLARDGVTHMERKGWKGPRPDNIPALDGQASVDLTLPGSGRATVSATRERPTTIPAFNQVTISLHTDCLRNSSWHR
ncbi:hypothetical protein [Streptomyces sp. NPDC050485]|uniref:hypothetical protein n=1 Tax=Streptomyces sp. NPDC050485 TaxID=3365617 RepID=UPI0037A59BF1